MTHQLLQNCSFVLGVTVTCNQLVWTLCNITIVILPDCILADWLRGLSDHLMFLFCSMTGFVCTVCFGKLTH